MSNSLDTPIDPSAIKRDGPIQVSNVMKDDFGFEIPQACEGVPTEILNPRETWGDGTDYDSAADHLANMFGENFSQFEKGTSQEVLNAAPKPLS